MTDNRTLPQTSTESNYRAHPFDSINPSTASNQPSITINNSAPVFSKKPYRHSFSATSTTASNTNTSASMRKLSTSRHNSRRSSSFASSSSPWARRRSFLSQTMISNEKHLVYQVYGAFGTDCPVYSISLSESQGFTWNQDLFASQYQQRSGVIYADEDKDVDLDLVKSQDDGDDYEGYADVFFDDEDLEEGIDGSNRRLRTLSYSASNDNGINKVKVIDIKLDENDKKW